MHTFCFLQFIPCRFLVIATNYYEADAATVSRASWAYLAAYGVISALDFGLIAHGVLAHAPGAPPVLPPWLTMACDYAWFLCLPLTRSTLPPAPALLFHYELVSADSERGGGRRVAAAPADGRSEGGGTHGI